MQVSVVDCKINSALQMRLYNNAKSNAHSNIDESLHRDKYHKVHRFTDRSRCMDRDNRIHVCSKFPSIGAQTDESPYIIG